MKRLILLFAFLSAITLSAQTSYRIVTNDTGGTVKNGLNTNFDEVDDELALKAGLASPTFTGTPLAPTASVGTNTTQIATTAFVKANAFPLATSLIYPSMNSFQAVPFHTGGAGSRSFEIVNIGNAISTSDNIANNYIGFVNVAGRPVMVRNMSWDQTNTKWLTPDQSASAYGSSAFEAGGEACILHASPTGVNFSDVPHELFLSSANGTDGETNHRITSGYYNQIKAPLFARFNSSTYVPASTNNNWNQTSGADPLVWLSTGEAKGTDSELMRLEGNLATPGLYFARSNGTLASKTVTSTSATAGRLGWKFYDGDEYHLTSQIDAISNSSVSNNSVGSSIRFLTSADNTTNLTERVRLSSAGNLGVGLTAPTSILHTTSFATGYVAKTALYTLTAADYTVEVTSGTHTQTLPTAVGITGRQYVITNSGSGTVTVGTTSSQTFVNVTATPTTLTLAQFKFVMVQSNGANWLVISQN